MCDVAQVRAEMAVLDPMQFPTACRYLQDNLMRAESADVPCEPEYLDLASPKTHIRVTKKVIVPVHMAPGFNFVGKLLGQGGSFMKDLSTKNKCRIFVFGRGSTRDEYKEMQLLQSGDPQYTHFNEPLHVKIETIAPPALAYERMNIVLTALKEKLVPDEDWEPPTSRGRGRGGMRGRGGSRGGGFGGGFGRQGGFEDSFNGGGFGMSNGNMRGGGARGSPRGGRGGPRGRGGRGRAAPY